MRASLANGLPFGRDDEIFAFDLVPVRALAAGGRPPIDKGAGAAEIFAEVFFIGQ